MLVSQPKGPRFESRNFFKFYIFDDFPQISTVKDFNFQLFGVLRGSTLRFDGSPLLYLTFYSNLSGRGVLYQLELEGQFRSKSDRMNKVIEYLNFGPVLWTY